MVSSEGKAKYKKEVLEGQPNLLDVLEAYPSCKPSVEALLEFLPALAPREYSVSSAREVHGEEMHFAFSAVSYETAAGRTRKGVATSWLSSLAEKVIEGTSAEPVRVPIFLRPSKDFCHPPKVSDPIIMIGPGTGVSPFRGFAHYRGSLQSRSDEPKGEAWLFYGCRDRTKDLLYETDFLGLADSGVIDKYERAFSREQKEKVYVQHKIWENRAELQDLILSRNAYVFICGDGKSMAKDVDTKLSEILCHGQEGLKTKKEAEDLLKAMQKNGRYVRDIWS